ncbi:MAG TPA: lantibiotic dehydratase [Blastocatellia bacterium]|nr:lantibiotic dehydratase [Blastocatellia bacterium]
MLSCEVETSTASDDLLKDSNVEPHLVPLAGAWSLWRTVCLRSTGFPASRVLNLAASNCARAADELVAQQSVVKSERDRCLGEIGRAIHAHLQQPERNETGLRLLRKAESQARKGEMPEPAGLSSEIRAALGQWGEAGRRAKELESRYEKEFADGTSAISNAVRDEAKDDRFREAVIWQNRSGWHTGAEVLLRREVDSAERDSKHRQHEELIANYLQRYCLKNDTIGYFGPVGWARIVPDKFNLEVEPGRNLLASRSVFFESWCIESLAMRLSGEEGMREWAAPRLLPHVCWENGTARMPGNREVKLSDEMARLLGECNGNRSARQLAADMLGRSEPDRIETEEEVYEMLDFLRKKGIIAWAFQVPLCVHPERRLSELLERIEDKALRERSLGMLAQLNDVLTALSGAAGNADRVDEALNVLEARFKALTGIGPTRRPGATYAGRTLAYEDCVRDIDMKIGGGLVEAIADPLSLLLTSARWISFEVGRLYRDSFRELYSELARKCGSRNVSAAEFWVKADAILNRDSALYSNKAPVADSVIPEFRNKWSDILGPPKGERRAVYQSNELRPRVEQAFRAPRPGWIHARYQSPDIMISAPDYQAIEKGEYEMVLGEMHLGVHGFNGSLFLAQHPRPEEIQGYLDSDFADPHIMPVLSKNLPSLTVRTGIGRVPRSAYRLETSPNGLASPEDRRLPIGSLTVESEGDSLWLKSRDGRIKLELVDAMGAFLSGLIMDFFSILPPEKHTPRIVFDRLTVCRETWRFDADELEFAFESDERKRFIAARRWMSGHDLPRFLFVRTPGEKKPFYVDMDSAIFINTFSKMVRREKASTSDARTVTVMEMLPAHGGMWLPDSQGNKYASELRMVAYDRSR